MVSSLSILLNASGLELAARRNIDLNRELRTTGIGNMLSVLSPGFVGFMQISLTVINFKMKARSRVVGLIAVVIIGLTIAFGESDRMKIWTFLDFYRVTGRQVAELVL